VHSAATFLRHACIALALLAGSAYASAIEGSGIEQRVQRITSELRCVVCQNQTIADSQAELAVNLKQQVRDMLAQGMSDRQAVDFMVERYGDFVLYRPPLKTTTVLLWFGPLLLLLGGFGFLVFKLRGIRALPDDDPGPGEPA
jgi:cytochrome c-type biogenesis protein CcmH